MNRIGPLIGKNARVMMRLIAAAILSMTLLLAACTPGSSDKSAAEAGTIVADGSSDPGHIWVMTPIGRIDFTLTEPTQELPIYDRAYDRAEDGAKFIGVSWNWDFRSRPAPMTTARGPAPSVTVVIDKKRYKIDEVMRAKAGYDNPIGFFGTAWIAVGDAPESLAEADPAIELTYDGLTQTVEADDTPGSTGTAADALYRSPDSLARHTLDCGAGRAPRGWQLPTEQCSLDVMDVPYYESVGWAADRKSWTVITIRATPGAVASRGSYSRSISFAEEAPTVTYSLDNAKPVKVIQPAGSSWGKGSVGDTVVFETDGVAQGDLKIRALFRSEPGDDPTTLGVTWESDLG